MKIINYVSNYICFVSFLISASDDDQIILHLISFFLHFLSLPLSHSHSASVCLILKLIVSFSHSQIYFLSLPLSYSCLFNQLLLSLPPPTIVCCIWLLHKKFYSVWITNLKRNLIRRMKLRLCQKPPKLAFIETMFLL